MMKNNKQQLLSKSFLDNLSDEANSSDLLDSLKKELLEKNKVQPPAFVYARIQNEIRSQAVSSIAEQSFIQKFISSVINPVGAVSIITVAAVIIIAIKMNFNSPIIFMENQMSKTPIVFTDGNKHILETLSITNTQKGKIALFQGKKKNTYVLEKGSWDIKLNHNKQKKKSIFHFPGMVVMPLGTAFKVRIVDDKSIMTLYEGKAKVLYYDGLGKINAIKNYQAPVKIKSTSIYLFSITKINIDRIINSTLLSAADLPLLVKGKILINENKTNLERKRNIDKKVVVDATWVKYQEYFTQKVIVLTDNGDRLSGTLINAKKEMLYLKTDSGILKIKESLVKNINR